MLKWKNSNIYSLFCFQENVNEEHVISGNVQGKKVGQLIVNTCCRHTHSYRRYNRNFLGHKKYFKK